MFTTTTIRHTSAAVITTGLLTWATACGTQTADPARTAAAPAVKDRSSAVLQGAPDTIERKLAIARQVPQGSPDSIERRLAALQLSVPQGSPDTLERRLAAAEAVAGCSQSADMAERFSARVCRN